jgi:hypothetical protein
METTTDKKIEPNQHKMPQPVQEVSLEPGEEWRITHITDHIKVIVDPESQGLCEVFGRELPAAEPVFFHMGQKVAIYCWKAVRLQISGAHEYLKSKKTKPMEYYANISYALNSLRNEAL